jgi:hypothetical protein
MSEIVGHVLSCDFSGRTGTDNLMYRQRTWSQTPLLAATVQNRQYLAAGPVSDKKGTDSLWAIKFVGSQGQQVDWQFAEIERQLANRLRRVRVKQDISRVTKLADASYVLDHAGFIVDVHD